MVRIDHYSHHDDPSNYFQRLQSYISSGASFSQPSPVAPYSSSTVSKSNAYADSPQRSEVTSRSARYPHSRTESSIGLWSKRYRDSASDSEKSGRSLRGENLREHDRVEEGERPRGWSRRRKIVIAILFVALVVLGIAIGLAVSLKKTSYHYTPSNAQVTNLQAFQSGGATQLSPNDVTTGTGQGQDIYIYYTGGPQNFPLSSVWVSFDDMWRANLAGIETSCSRLGYGTDNTPAQTQDIYTAIQDRANASLVDHRFILAVILQESHGCVRVGSTTSSSGVANPGLMQSHEGHTFSAAHASLSILAMVQDGTQGTASGGGLVQNLNRYGNPYSAARGYNSGHIAPSGDLSEAAGATACYVSDVANRLTGWVNAESTCPGDDE